MLSIAESALEPQIVDLSSCWNGGVGGGWKIVVFYNNPCTME
jgi:hypothetical protein